MKAVIPAAGLGIRFLPLTKEQPKEMLPLVDRPAIHWVVEEAVASGVDDVLIITGREKRAIEDYFDGSYKLAHFLKERENGTSGLEALDALREKVDIHYIRQREPRGLGDAVLTAEKHVGGEPFLVLLGDSINISRVPVSKQLMDLYGKLRASIIAVEEVPREKLSSYGVVDGTEEGERLLRIRELVEKPGPEKAPSNLGISGRYLLTPGIFDCIRATPPGWGGEIQLTDALRKLLDTEPLYAYRFEGKRYDIGTKLDWMQAHLILSLERHEYRDPLLATMRELLDADRGRRGTKREP
jgi:UTP--glucose-1-phosphate uridylyltransferase